MYYTLPEIQFISHVNTQLRFRDNILLTKPDEVKLELGRQVCEKLKTKTLLEVNLQIYSLLVHNLNKDKSTIRYNRYMQWYSIISTNSIRFFCPQDRLDKVRVFTR